MVPGETVTVLVVEDNDVDAEAVERAFRRCKIANPIVTVTDGIAALDRLRGTNGTERLARPYLVLLDLNMPRMDGLEFLAELRADPAIADTVVFVLSTSDRDADKVSAYGHQVAGYVVKTRLDEGFLDMVTMIDAYWRVVQFPPSI